MRDLRYAVMAFAVMVMLAAPVAGRAATTVDLPNLNYINVLQALIKLGRYSYDSQEFLDAYIMGAQCEIVHGSYRDEFRWQEARKAVKKFLDENKDKFPTRFGMRSQIMFGRYDEQSKYFLFSEDTPINNVNTFTTDPRTNDPECNRKEANLLPTYYRVITNNPVTLPGIRLTEDQGKDLANKFQMQGNRFRKAWIRFNVDILDANYMGPSAYNKPQDSGQASVVKATLNSIEFFSDPEYKNRFYIYTPQ